MYTIAIDGLSGAGKSTIAKKLSEILNIKHLDTGAMYRALAYSAMKKGIEVNSSEFDAFIENFSVDISGEKIFVEGEDITYKIRQNQISMAASKISLNPRVREKLVDLQRKIAKEQSIVLDGRDIGTVVLPHAQYKFFITADAEIRAKRRMEQLGEYDYQTILEQINSRDYQDRTRDISPLKCADDAIIIDTTNETADESIARILTFLQRG